MNSTENKSAKTLVGAVGAVDGSTCYDEAGTSSANYGLNQGYVEIYDSERGDDNYINIKRPNTATNGSRVKTAAAHAIFKKWGYDPTDVIGKDTPINYNNFKSQKNF